jgi:PKD repeat protein
VWAQPPPLSVAGVQIFVEHGPVPLTVRFVASITGGLPSIFQSWRWEFGDGVWSSEASPTHTYSTYGEYKWTVTTRDAWGYEAASAGEVHVANRLRTRLSRGSAP